MDKTELYPRFTRDLNVIKKKIDESEIICKENKKYINDFLIKLKADGISTAQQLAHMSRIKPIAELLGKTSFRKATKKEMESVFAQWRSGHDYSQHSINKLISILKCFFRWVYDLSSEDKAPDSIRWLKKAGTRNMLRSEDLWTEEEVRKAINACTSDLWKVYLGVAHSTGLRPGELRSLKIGDIVFNDRVVRIYCRGKTEKKTGERMVPASRCYDALKAWIDRHPKKHDRNAWLWTHGDKPLPEENYRIQLSRLKKKCRISKPAHPYILRHGFCTRAYRELPGTVASTLCGHVPGSKEASTYMHLSAQDLENAVLGMDGKPVKKREEDRPICSKCGATLQTGAYSCGECGYQLSIKSAAEMDQNEQMRLRLADAILKHAEHRPDIIKVLMDDLEGA